MDAVLDEPTFVDFGEDLLNPFRRQGLSRVEGETDELRAQVRQYVPKKPGVYGMIDSLGRLVYIGKSKALRNRLLSYFLPNNEEDKAGRIIQSAFAIVWEEQPSDFAALVREQSLIRNFQPRFNVQGMPKRQQPIFVCLGKSPAEQLYTSRRHDPSAAVVLGPLVGAARANRAVEILNRSFRLRDCSSKQPCSFTDQLQLFDIELRPGCIRLEIGTCLGPCISACSRTDYQREVQRATEFLRGENESAIIELQQQMDELVSNQHYEQAARVRDDLRAVSWLAHRAEDVAQAREHFTFVYHVKSETQGDVWYLIRRGVIEGALRAPRTSAQKSAAESQVARWLQDDNTVGSGYTPRPETLALVASWFRNNRSEMAHTFLPGQALARGKRGRRQAKQKQQLGA